MALLEFDELNHAKILVIGVGGGGGNAINTMISSNLDGVEFVAANTDCQALKHNQAPCKIQLGAKLTKGLGAGANPEIGRSAALEDTEAILETLQRTDGHRAAAASTEDRAAALATNISVPGAGEVGA